MAQCENDAARTQDIGEYAAAAYRRSVDKFLSDVDKFCETAGIPSGINSMLHYRCGACVGPGWSLMYKAPMPLLAASRAFQAFRDGLDPDFRDELIDDETTHAVVAQLRRSPDLLEWMRGRLGADCAV